MRIGQVIDTLILNPELEAKNDSGQILYMKNYGCGVLYLKGDNPEEEQKYVITTFDNSDNWEVYNPPKKNTFKESCLK